MLYSHSNSWNNKHNWMFRKIKLTLNYLILNTFEYLILLCRWRHIVPVWHLRQQVCILRTHQQEYLFEFLWWSSSNHEWWLFQLTIKIVDITTMQSPVVYMNLTSFTFQNFNTFVVGFWTSIGPIPSPIKCASTTWVCTNTPKTP